MSNPSKFPSAWRLRTWGMLLWIGVVTGVQGPAQSILPEIDPVCGLARISVKGVDTNVVYELKATDDLGAPGVWEALMRMVPTSADQSWLDFHSTGHHQRFYRLDTVTPVPERPVENFGLLDQFGSRHELIRQGDSRAIALVFTDNAHLKAAASEVNALASRYSTNDVRFWLINPTDSRTELAAAAKSLNLELPVLHDLAQLVARTYQAGTALETVLIDQAEMRILYRGSLVDRCAAAGGVDQSYVALALDQFLSQASISIQATKPLGDSLEIASAAVPDYSTEIAPLLQSKCIVCHRTGDIGFWSMTNHTVVSLFKDKIRANLLAGRMPPWHADPAFNRFENDSSLAPSEASRLLAWLDAGAPRGAGEDTLETHPPAPAADWSLGTPDLVLKIPVQQLPADGQIPYRYLLVANPLTADTWLRATDIHPGNRQVVHHSLVFTAKDVTDFLQVKGGLGGFFAAYVPGMIPVEFPTGTGKLLKKGSYLVFQMHYTPNGKATSDQTEIGLYFSKIPPAHALSTTAAYNTDFLIPPGVLDQEAVAETVVPVASKLYEMSPHMHFRGARMRFEAFYPDGSNEVLLSVPGYEFNWQTLYRLAEPKSLPAGTKIRITGGFDNSPWNPWNPDPTRVVRFGEQTTDEMLIGYLNLAPE